MTARKKANGEWLKTLLEKPEMLMAPQIIIPKLLWSGGLSCLFGREKSGKTTLLAQAVAQASKGESFFGEKCPKNTFVWCGFEEMLSESVRRFAALGGDGDAIWMITMLKGDWVQDLERAIKETECAGVIVDTLSALLGRAKVKDENDAGRIQSEFMPPLLRMAREMKVGFLFDGHTNKSEGDPRGSTALTAGMDCNFTMKAPNGNDRPRREVKYEGRWGAGKFTIEFENGLYQLIEDELPLPDRIVRYILSHPGCSQKAIRGAVHGSTEAIRDEITRLIRADAIKNLGTKARSEYSVVETGNGTANGPPENPHNEATGPGLGTDVVPDSEPLEAEAGPPRYGPFEEAHYERR